MSRVCRATPVYRAHTASVKAAVRREVLMRNIFTSCASMRPCWCRVNTNTQHEPRRSSRREAQPTVDIVTDAAIPAEPARARRAEQYAQYGGADKKKRLIAARQSRWTAGAAAGSQRRRHPPKSKLVKPIGTKTTSRHCCPLLHRRHRSSISPCHGRRKPEHPSGGVSSRDAK